MFGLLELARGLGARGEGKQVQDRTEQSNQEENSRKDAADDQRENARRRMSLAEVGEDVQRDDGTDRADDQEVGLEVAWNDQGRQVFFAGGELLGVRWRRSTSCEIRSRGTGKTITVFRSTPISVSVCR